MRNTLDPPVVVGNGEGTLLAEEIVEYEIVLPEGANPLAYFDVRNGGFDGGRREVDFHGVFGLAYALDVGDVCPECVQEYRLTHRHLDHGLFRYASGIGFLYLDRDLLSRVTENTLIYHLVIRLKDWKFVILLTATYLLERPD